MSRLNEALAETAEATTRLLDELLAPVDGPVGRVVEAMRYSALGGGKRLRPALAFAAARTCGALDAVALPAALAVELVHAYALVHDDLPAMDDAEERRGRPCVHVKFGEANAVLVGDALLPAAFRAVADCPGAVDALARAAGSRALVGGQVDDLGIGLTDPRRFQDHQVVSGGLDQGNSVHDVWRDGPVGLTRRH